MKRRKSLAALLVLIMLLATMAPTTTAAYTVKKQKEKRLKLGTTMNVYQSGATYYSRDEEILYVDSKGLVTAKKIGKANIVIQKGDVKKVQPIEVVANGRKTTAVTVCADELELKTREVTLSPIYQTETAQETGGLANDGTGSTDNRVATGCQYTVRLSYKNVSDFNTQEVRIECRLGKTDLTLVYGTIKAGATSVIEQSGTLDYVIDENTPLVLLKKQVHSNNMICQYNYKTKKFTYTYGTEDTTPPVISGFVGKDSYNGSFPYMVVYGNDKSYNYFKYVKATDDRGGKVKLTVDTSKVNYKKAGTYTITYTAKDKAGNKAKAKAKIQVRIAGELDKMADAVLKKITKPSWSDTKKARAIYSYTRGHIAYIGYSDKSSWEKEAANGIRYGKGDCFTYYAVSRLLLTRAGIPNIEVRRVKPDYRGHTRHWWNMAYVQGDFYHFDASPRYLGGRFCLVTDGQLKGYSKSHGNSHIWAYDKVPKSGTKHLSDIF